MVKVPMAVRRLRPSQAEVGRGMIVVLSIRLIVAVPARANGTLRDVPSNNVPVNVPEVAVSGPKVKLNVVP